MKRKEWIGVIAAAVLVTAVVLPQTGIADYMTNIYIDAAYDADTMLVDVTTGDGIWSDPDLTTVTVLTGEDIGETESVLVNLGDISGYREVYVKLLATTWQDSIVCKFGSSESLGWAAGNTAYFDFIPSDADVDHWETGTNTLGTYGTTIPLRDAYGACMPGPFGLLEIENNNIVWDDATDNDLLGVSVIVIKRK